MKRLERGLSWDARTKEAAFRVVVVTPDGRFLSRRHTETFEDANAAREAYHEFRRLVLAGAWPKEPERPIERPKQVPTFREFAETGWRAELETRVANGKAGASTVEFYGHAMRAVLPLIGDKPLDRITAAVVEDMTAAITRSGRTRTTARSYAQLVLRVLRVAVDREAISANPVRRRVDLPEAEKPELELTVDEETRLLLTFGDRDRFFEFLRKAPQARIRNRLRPHDGNWQMFVLLRDAIVVSLETGLRKSDLLALAWSSVDLDGGWITIRRTQKTKRPFVHPITERAREVLLRLRRDRETGDLVFVTRLGHRLTRGAVQDLFSVAKAMAGLTRRVRFHDLRHTYATSLATAGVPIQIIAKALGHTTVKMSERYARVSRSGLEAIRKVKDESRRLRLVKEGDPC